MRIAFATWSGEPCLTADDQLAADAFDGLGHAVSAVPWDAHGVDWTTYDVVVLRSTWNYHLAFEPFLAWLAGLEIARVPVINPISLLRWNAHKRYLFDLEAAGIAVPDTVLIRRGKAGDVGRTLGARQWTTAVVKPAVSASAHHTELLIADSHAAFVERLCAVAARMEADVLVQELVPEVQAHGECSLVCFDGVLSHAVLKRPAPGEFRVQEKFGGAISAMRTEDWMERAAQAIVGALPQRPVYARLDLVPRARGFMLMEVELIEPSLFLALDPGAAERFAATILGQQNPTEEPDGRPNGRT